MYGYIYKTTNLINNKIYIGQKKSPIFLNEKYLGSGIRLKSAIEHYGKENFKVEMLDFADTREELNQKEIDYIKKFNSQNLDIGYNLSNGGDGGFVGKVWNKGLTKEIDNRLKQTDKTKQKRSKSLKKAYKDGRHKINYTPDIRKKMSDKAKQREHKPTTLGRKCMTNGEINKMVTLDEVEDYKSKGFYFGKTCNIVAWNKGLTKETDERVMKYTTSRNKHFKNGESIGFCKTKN